MNSLDIIILVIVLISALIALSRGLIKEVLSIIGWVLGVVAVICLLPYIRPLAAEYIDSDLMAIIVSSFVILIVFFIIWIYLTSAIVGKVRSSKLSGMDRVLGLFFGIVRACLLVILLYILIGWIVPEKSQPETFKNSKYFQLAGSFAEPIEKLIPKSTKETVSKQMNGDKKPDNKTDKKADKKATKINSDMDNLFEKLAQPQIKKKEESKVKKDSSKGYNKAEQKSLDRLIEMTVEE